MGSSRNGLQTSALLIRTLHWQRRQYCNLFCTLGFPILLFILIRVLNNVLTVDNFQEIAVEQNPSGAFAPKPFNPQTCLLPDGESLEDIINNPPSPESLSQQCSSTGADGKQVFLPMYVVPTFTQTSIAQGIGSHDARNPANNTGLLSQFSLDIYEYPPATNPSPDSVFNFDTSSNYSNPLLFEHFFGDSSFTIYQAIVSASNIKAVDFSFAAKTIPLSSKQAFMDYLYDRWYVGSSVDRTYTGFTFDSFENSDNGVSLSTTVFWNESQSFSTDGCYGLCPILSSMSNLYSSVYSAINEGKTSNIFLRKMPKVKVNNAPGFLTLISGIFIVILTHTSLPWTLNFLVYEKSTRMRSYMMSMGLSRWLYWVGTYLSLYLVYIASIIVVYIAGRVLQNPFFTLNSPVAIILLFLLWGNALISLAIFLEPLFSDAQTAQICGWVLVIVTNFLGGPFIGQKVSDSRTSTGMWIAMMLHPSFAYMRSVYYAAAINESGIGISVTSNIIKGNDFGMCSASGPFCWSYGFLIFDTVLYLTLAAYVRYIIDMLKSGAQLHPLFFLGFNRKSSDFKSHVEGKIRNDDVGEDVMEEERQVQELVSNGVDSFNGVVINKVTKTYMSKNPVHAVKQMSLIARQNEILTILGHNGAGKSSLFKCLVGEIPVSDGECYINGYSIHKDVDKIHSSMGLVTQESIFWEDLNLNEHLYFFGRVKGIHPKAELKQAVDQALSNVHLDESRKKSVKNLSGGMKRRLLVSIAMMGPNCKYVILDEPSTGLDLLSRERLWEAINKMKGDKSIILTTHSLEEAETLSSKIAIMSNGQLKCVGKSEDLKARLGDGHRLILSLTSASLIDPAMSEIHSHIPHAALDTVVGSNVEILFPKDTNLTKVLRVVAEKKSSLGIRDWAIQQSSLEDVFLKVTRHYQQNRGNVAPKEAQEEIV